MLSKDEFVRRILDGAQREVEAEADTGLGEAMLDGFDGFDVSSGEQDAPADARFAQLLLEESSFGRGETLPRREMVLGDQKTNRFLPHGATYWAKTTERPFHILLFDLEQTGSSILGDPFFRQNDQLEDALHRIVQDALEGFERGGEGRTADRKKGAQVETLCVVSVVDDRKDGPKRQIVCFGTKCTATDALEVFTLREEARDWDRPLAEEHLGQLFERHFKRLGTGTRWQDAFVSGEERRKARKLMEECARLIPDETQLRGAIQALLDEIAGSFGIKRKGGRGGSRLSLSELPANHSIAVDPPEARKEGFQNPFQGVRVFDSEERLLGYIVYVLDSKEKAARLRRELEEHNHFHNVLVIYPDKASAVLELWQGDTLLRGRLTSGPRRSRFDGDGGVIQLLSRFFVVSNSEIATPEHLANELAWRALHLKALALEETQGETGPLATLYESFNETLAKSTPAEFADAYAQTITYGLLAARWLSRDVGTRFTRKSAASYLPSSSPFLRELFTHLLDIPFDTNLSWLLDDLTSLLSRTRVNDVFAAERDPSIHFFQDFLTVYDNDTRRARGVYYTPEEIVEYMVALTDQTLCQVDAGLRLGGPGVRVVDPATGTGTFLRAVIQHTAHRTGVREDLTTTFESIRGMELMVAPYAICHLRLSLLRRELAEGRGTQAQPLSVVLTNTLERPSEPAPDLFERSPALAHEAQLANTVKREGGFTVVIGNPPYKNNSAVTLAQVAERFPRLLKSSRDAAAAGKRNIRDDYVWFFCAADALVDGGGLVSFVTSDSYLKKSSHRLFREEVLKNYRIHEITRLGEGIFSHVGPRIGFAVITMERRPTPLKSPAVAEPFRFVDLGPLAANTPARELGTHDDPRLKWLSRMTSKLSSGQPFGDDFWSPAHVEMVHASAANSYRLLPDAGTESGLAAQIVVKKNSPYKPLFLKKWPGIITAFDVLLKDANRDVLQGNIEEFFRVAHSGSEAEVDALASRLGCKDKMAERLAFLCNQVSKKGLHFTEDNLVPAFSGSIPDGHLWSPPVEYAHWIYFEPEIQIPRNTNPGKDAGWGWMQQWRPKATHETFPKLIFATSTNKRYGYRAYVVDGGWYTKLHGAASQQYHYVSLVDPTQSARIDGTPNNLSERGLAVLRHIQNAGLRDGDLLHLIAAVYNSSFARDYITREREPMLPLPDFSVVKGAALVRVAQLARQLRCGWQLLLPETDQTFPCLDCSSVDAGNASQMVDEAQAELDALVASMVGG